MDQKAKLVIAVADAPELAAPLSAEQFAQRMQDACADLQRIDELRDSHQFVITRLASLTSLKSRASALVIASSSAPSPEATGADNVVSLSQQR